jgi:hypothetical protein
MKFIKITIKKSQLTKVLKIILLLFYTHTFAISSLMSNQTTNINRMRWQSALITYQTNQVCDYLMKFCFCKHNSHIDTYILFCNDKNLHQVPDFSFLSNWNKTTKTYFQLLDFRQSSIRKLHAKDFQYLYVNTNYEHARNSNLLIYSNHYNNFEFDGIVDIEDYAFEEFSRINKFNNRFVSLNVRFNRSDLQFGPLRKPFDGFYVKTFYLNHLANAFFYNRAFDKALIGNLFIENSLDFLGFLDGNEQPPSVQHSIASDLGLLYGYHVTNSYQKTSKLCSHSLPTFVNRESFGQISIRKCASLTQIHPFTFYMYRHLKTLILSANNFTQIDSNSFRNLNELVFLDLSSNPVAYIPDATFIDLVSLKSLMLQNTNIKAIGAHLFKGLYSLEELSLMNTKRLTSIDKHAFADAKRRLRFLNLDNTSVSLIGQELDIDWLDNLNLALININLYDRPPGFTFDSDFNFTCKFLSSIPINTLFYLKRNAQCNCFTYWLYRAKQYDIDKWLYKTPDCYNAQMKSMLIGDAEKSCNFDFYTSKCDKTRTTTATTTTMTFTTVTTMITTTTTIRTTTSTQAPMTRSSWNTMRPPRPSPTTQPLLTTQKIKNPTLRRIRNLDMRKLFYVLATIIAISILAIILTIIGFRLQAVISQQKKKLHNRRQQQRTSFLLSGMNRRKSELKAGDDQINRVDELNESKGSSSDYNKSKSKRSMRQPDNGIKGKQSDSDTAKGLIYVSSI